MRRLWILCAVDRDYAPAIHATRRPGLLCASDGDEPSSSPPAGCPEEDARQSGVPREGNGHANVSSASGDAPTREASDAPSQPVWDHLYGALEACRKTAVGGRRF